MRNINLNLTPTSEKNLEYIKAKQDIMQNTQAIRTAINFYAQYLKKEEAKVNVYSKSSKTASVVKPRMTKEEQEREEGAQLCVLDFEGIICDENGDEDPNGLYCKYDSYEQVTPKKIIKALDMINPLDRLSGLLASGEKYRNTNSQKVQKFLDEGNEFTLLEGKTE